MKIRNDVCMDATFNLLEIIRLLIIFRCVVQENALAEGSDTNPSPLSIALYGTDQLHCEL